MINRTCVLALLLILVCAVPALAENATSDKTENAGFTILNNTIDPIKIFSKTGSLTYTEVKPLTVKEWHCTSPFKELCFDKKDGTTKAKVVRVDRNGLDEWSGLTCNRIRIKPGQKILVDYAEDGKHIECFFVEDELPEPDFKRADLNNDGRVDIEEARRYMNAEQFKEMDKDNDGSLTTPEWRKDVRKYNPFKGIAF